MIFSPEESALLNRLREGDAEGREMTLLSIIDRQNGEIARGPDRTDLYKPVIVFYFMAGALDRLGLIEHGVAVRHPFLSDEGKRLLEALRATTGEAIDEATGPAYDGTEIPE